VTIYVFTGPTLAPSDAAAELDAIYLPPAAQGDVYLAAIEAPAAIGIIDGSFAHAPSIAHKEILWAMARGIRVYGSASMGALRAAELASFGMRGVGAIFEAFRRGELEDDDEVAVAHATAELEFRAQSEAMVNVRATLRAALAAGVLRPATHDALISAAKAMFYADRSYPALLAVAREAGLAPQRELDALRAWLPAGRVDAKRTDALAMLRAMRVEASEPQRVRYAFQHTEAWETVRRRALARRAEADGATPASLREELVVAGMWERERGGLVGRALALELARRAGFEASTAAVDRAAGALVREHALPDAEALERWMEEQGAGERFLRAEAEVRWAEEIGEVLAEPLIADQLRRRGGFAALRERAADKRRRLAARGLEAPTLAELGLTEDELWRWYFEERLSRSIPGDLAGYARAQGLPDARALLRMVLRERAYLS